MKQFRGFIIGVIITTILCTCITVFAGSQNIQGFFNNIKLSINGKEVTNMDTEPFIYNGRTYIPARYVAEGLGATVKWNETSNTVEITGNVSENKIYSWQEKTLSNASTIKYKDGSEYSGDIVDGKPNGYGIYSFSNGALYYGHFKDGVKSGLGTLISNDSTIIVGTFENDNPSSDSIATLKDGSKYYLYNGSIVQQLNTPTESPQESPSSSPITTSDAIESRIDGDFNGWDGETIFKLQNGQIWQQDSYAYTYHYAYSPKVLIYKDGTRYKMKVDGVDSTIYVKQIK